MTIGIDASRANNTQKTGVEWYAFFLIQELKKITPPDVKVILYSERPLEGELAVLPANWSSKVLKWPPKRLWTQIRMSYEMMVHPPDVLFIPAHVFPLIHPSHTVMTVHDVAALRFQESYNWFERWYSLWSAKYAVQHLWKVIVPSLFTKKEIEKAIPRCIPTNISVVAHGFDTVYGTQKTDIEVETVLKKYKIQKPYFISLGRLEEKKNTKRIIESFRIFKESYSKNNDFSLVLIGKPGYGYKQVEELLQKTSVREDIKILGWLPVEETQMILSSAEALLFPSLYEGFGFPVLEAFAAGTSVISSKDTSTQEIGGDALLLVNPEDCHDIVEAMETLVNNPDLKHQLIEKGKKRVQDFSWEKCARKTLELFLQ